MDNISRRITELDALRGIAAISVVLFHYTTHYRREIGYNFPVFYDFSHGHYGVQLFFMISGFVIFMSLMKIKSLGDFAYKRFSRLYPTYWVCLSITLIIVTFSNISQLQLSFIDNAANFLMFHSIFRVPNVDGSYWSLLPELIFYVLMAMLYRFKLIKNINLIAIIWLLCMVVNAYRPTLLGTFLNLRFGMFFISGIMFYRLRFEKTTIVEHIIIFLSLVCVIAVRRDWEYFSFAVMFVFVFYLFVYQKLGFLNLKLLLFLGKISYPLYLLHQAIGFVIIIKLTSAGCNEFIAIAVAILVSIILSWIVTNYIESPILDRLSKIKESSKTFNLKK